MQILEIQRIDLIRIAQASLAKDNAALVEMVNHLKEIGPYTEASQDEIDDFDLVFDEAEAGVKC